MGLRVVDRCLVALDLCIELVDFRLLRVELLPRGVILLGKSAVALEIELRIFQVGFVLRFFGLRHFERRLKGPRIDLHEHIAFIHHLALAKSDLDHLAIDPAAHGHGVVGLHDAKTVQVDRKVRVLDRLGHDRDGRGPFGLAFAGPGRHVKPAQVTEKRNSADAQHACQGAES